MMPPRFVVIAPVGLNGMFVTAVVVIICMTGVIVVSVIVMVIVIVRMRMVVAIMSSIVTATMTMAVIFFTRNVRPSTVYQSVVRFEINIGNGQSGNHTRQ